MSNSPMLPGQIRNGDRDVVLGIQPPAFDDHPPAFAKAHL